MLGALAAQTATSGTFVLPGTHSKWVRVAGGRITEFATYMTGEVFAALKGHTILGRLMSEGPATGAGFAAGVAAARKGGAPGELLHHLFATRALGLFGMLPQTELADYLSGLLIGAELTAAAASLEEPIILIGADALVARYREAAVLLGIPHHNAPADVVVQGSHSLARQAGLIA